MKKISLTLSSLILILTTINAQLVVNTGTLTPTQYVQNVLVGTGVVVTNVTFTGSLSQIGSFNASNAFVGLPNGLILASGNVTNAVGPNNNGGSGVNLAGAGNVDLTTLSGSATFDAAILEFDFIPVGDSIKFKYVFASEEYLEFVGGTVNDAFGFFLSGPGITGPFANSAQNIAIIPNTTTPVAINNVNSTLNSAFYIDNGTGTNSPFNSNNQYIQYDGRTVVLTAKAQVICGQTYHLKLAISDAGDGIFDSGVFLEGGSLTSEGIDVQIVTATGDSSIIEGCADAQICFTRIDTAGAITVPITYTGTAINGIDYNLLPDSVSFLSGQNSTCITITPTADFIVEGTESIIITVRNINICGDTIFTTGSLLIIDESVIHVSANNLTLFCPTSGITIPATATGGLAPYSFFWISSNGDTLGTTRNLNLTATQTDTIIVAATDSCNLAFGYDTIIVTVIIPPLIVDAGNDTSIICNGSVTLNGSASGGNPGYTYNWMPGNISTQSFVAQNISASTSFILTVTDQCNTSVTDTVQVNLSPPPIPVTANAGNDTTLTCLGLSANINGSAFGGNPGYTYNWMPGNISTQNFVAQNINTSTSFILTVTDQCNVSNSDTVQINVDYLPISLLGNSGDQVLICEDIDHFLDVYTIPTLGTLPYTYAWNNNSTDSVNSVNITNPTSFIVSVTDACNVNVNDTISFTFTPYTPMKLAITAIDTVCAGSEIQLLGTASDGLPPYTFNWNDGISFVSATNPTTYTPLTSGTQVIGLSVTDQCEKTEEVIKAIEVISCEIIIPNVFTPNGDGINDNLVFTGLEFFTKNKLTVFNRWGRKILEKENYQNDWDGEDYNNGTYFYVLELNDNSNTIHKGTFTLFK